MKYFAAILKQVNAAQYNLYINRTRYRFYHSLVYTIQSSTQEKQGVKKYRGIFGK
jgi:hypothetical protein